MPFRLRHLGPRVAALAVALAAAAVASSADAFCRSTTCSGECGRDIDGCKTEGAKLYWASKCVGFSLQKDGSEHIEFSEFQRVAQSAFVNWSDHECEGGGMATIAFAPAAVAACHKAEYNIDGANANIVLFQDHKWSYTGVDNTLAKTTVTYDTDTGEILDADIELNHAYNEFSTGDDDVVYDLESIMTHEVGHFIGFDHTFDLIATMNAGYQEGTTELRSIEDDDLGALCAAYPPNRDGTCNPTPRGGFASECGADATEDTEDTSCSVAPEAGDISTRSTPYGWLGLLLGAAMLSVSRRRLS